MAAIVKSVQRSIAQSRFGTQRWPGFRFEQRGIRMRNGQHTFSFTSHTDALYPPPAILKNLAAAAGVQFNGSDPWDIQVNDPGVYQQILTRGSLGFGEAYMDGLWDCYALDELLTRLLRVNVEDRFQGWARVRLIVEVLRNTLFNLQNRNRSFRVGESHYDLGNDVFEAMLDPAMIYSCGYWENADSLQEAQLQKMDMICRKLQLKRGEMLLDIGCGWGGLAHYAASHYGVEVLGITVSREQQRLARERCRKLPVQIDLTDYRELQGEFEKVVSVGMFEHVGPKNYKTYFDKVRSLLKPEGLFLLHTIGNYKTLHYCDPWMNRYIFPNGKLPSAAELAGALDNRLVIEDWHNFGQDYDRTLMAWWQNFSHNWGDLKNHYSQRFYRMWKFYLHSCAGFFRSRQGQLWQLVLSKRQRSNIYRSIRSAP